MRKPHFRAVDGAIARAFEDGEELVVSRIEGDLLGGGLEERRGQPGAIPSSRASLSPRRRQPCSQAADSLGRSAGVRTSPAQPRTCAHRPYLECLKGAGDLWWDRHGGEYAGRESMRRSRRVLRVDDGVLSRARAAFRCCPLAEARRSQARQNAAAQGWAERKRRRQNSSEDRVAARFF